MLIKKGTLSKNCAVPLLTLNRTEAEIDALTVDETSLGFDSLSRLDLVLRVNQFFSLHSSGVDDYFLVKRKIGDWVELVLHHLALCGDDATFSFQTSGSTGNPSVITHEVTTLSAEARMFLELMLSHKEDSTRILSLVPPHHIYGFLFSCLLPSLADFETVDLHQKSPTSVIRQARSGDIIIATPFIWERLVKSGLQVPPDVLGVTSAGPSNALTWSAVGRLHLADLMEIYGATETGGIGFRKVQSDDFTLLPHLTQDHGIVRHRSANKTTLDLQDHLVWTGQNHFRLAGRIDQVIQVAGVNVSPQHVEQVISQAANVRAVHVRFENERLKAFVIPKNGQDRATVAREVQNHVSANLAPAARPGSITYGDQFPRCDFGKIGSWI